MVNPLVNEARSGTGGVTPRLRGALAALREEECRLESRRAVQQRDSPWIDRGDDDPAFDRVPGTHDKDFVPPAEKCLRFSVAGEVAEKAVLSKLLSSPLGREFLGRRWGRDGRNARHGES